MFTSLEVTSLTSGKQRSRSWSIGWKLLNRRFINQLICRLPLLAIWTLIVIFILYESLSDVGTKNNQESSEIKSRLAISYQQPEGQQASSNRMGELIDRQSSRQHSKQMYPGYGVVHETLIAGDTDPPDMITKVPVQLPPMSLDLTTKKSSDEYARLSKVFILILQSENFHLSKIYKNNYHQQHANHPTSLVKESIDLNHPIIIPAHIRLLIEILKAHKIEYTIDTTRTGLPTSLLTDQDDKIGSMKQYSVIVLDDFVKYTKLSRWVRDQLDRHCRKNQIGVITYIKSTDQHGNQAHDYRSSMAASHHLSTSRFHSPKPSQATDESLADQFPLKLKPIDKKLCNNSQEFPSCLVDYQLNELSPILRVLKRKQNFILRGPLKENLDQLPWISMSSNDITYEPLTWAKLSSKSEANSIELRKRNMPPSSKPHNTLEKDQNSQSAHYNLSSQSFPQALIYNRQQYNSTDEDYFHKNRVQFPVSVALPELEDSIEKMALPASSDSEDFTERYVLSMFDRGLYDGIRRVIFGGANHHWLDRILLLDAIEHLSSGKIITPLERYIQIDIDDIFVGEKGKRMNESDVEALIEAQSWLTQRISGDFKFNLGFSGKFFKHGLPAEIDGDLQLVSKAKEFTWFCHSWSHSKAHLSNGIEGIALELKRNLNFAREHQLPLIGHEAEFKGDSKMEKMPPTYAVAPHHSGVYPIHEPLYEAWRDVLNVQFTSTEEYPSLRPAFGRRAFVHKAIQVLPRQTCGLYTHTIYRRRYPGGFAKLERNIKGGELFETVLHNPVNIYMTHMSNYANDRLAPYTFMELVRFVQSHTNLELKYAASTRNQSGPSKLADYYFNLYPNERQPLWTNPCNDKRHLAIWEPEKHKYCSIVPKLLIVGPQKTGTTALYSFLKMNPLFKSSLISPIDFEEVQFFNDKHYFQGVDWYLSRFIDLSSSKAEATQSNNLSDESANNRLFVGGEEVEDSSFYFDKSATYFDDPKAPERASRLLPEARIVILLVNPADRAYSWYQHIKAHGDKLANSISFEQVITAKDGQLKLAGATGLKEEEEVNSALVALRNRCLHPGYYSQHLSRWLEYYPSKQIIIIDGHWFRHNPASVMNRLQLLLRIVQPLDYNHLLIYNERKGFFCKQNGSDAKCLGSSKGRKYPPMSEEARFILNRHYLAHNKQLARILSDIGQPLPIWLDESLSLGRLSSAALY